MARRRLGFRIALGTALLAPVAVWACFPLLSLTFENDQRLAPISQKIDYVTVMRALVPRSPWCPASADGQGACAGGADGGRASRLAGLDEAAAAAIEQKEQPVTLPASAAIYFQGADAFAAKNFRGAAGYFNALLRRPKDGTASRHVLAAFMLGRSYAALGDSGAAISAFGQARSLAASGEADPSFLATESLGEEARLHLARKEYGLAVRQYAEQAADGDDGALVSLTIAARRILADRAALPASVEDPLLQRLLIEAVFADTEPAPENAESLPAWGTVDASLAPEIGDGGIALVQAIRAAHTRTVGAVKLAQLAYSAGADDAARDLLAGQNGVVADWLRAKLALKSGNMVAAADAFAAAFRGIAAGQGDPAEEFSRGALAGDAATMAFMQAQFPQAMDILLSADGNFSSEIDYLGEYLISIDALEQFADQAAAGNTIRRGHASLLAEILARRLMRLQRFDEALVYFHRAGVSADTIKAAEDYVAARQQAAAASPGILRARALWQAAWLMRLHGIDIAATLVAPDNAGEGGNFPGLYGQDNSQPDAEGLFWGRGRPRLAQEKALIAANAPVPNRRFHYRYVASELAQQAAAEVEPRSQAYAALLCHAAQMLRPPRTLRSPEIIRAELAASVARKVASWSAQDIDRLVTDEVRDRAAIDAIWRRYVANGAAVPFAGHFAKACPEPDFDGIAKTQAKLRHIALRGLLHRAKPVVIPIGVVALLAAGVFAWRRRRAA